jgi:hypothetical protein
MDAGETDPDDLLPLLEICEDFLALASPPVRRGVDTVLHVHGITGGRGWLALSRLRLQNPTRAHRPPSGLR